MSEMKRFELDLVGLCESYEVTFERDDGRRGVYLYMGDKFIELPERLYTKR